MEGAFGLKVDEYKRVKSLERENLRNHMTDLELILTMSAEATTTTLHQAARSSRQIVAASRSRASPIIRSSKIRSLRSPEPGPPGHSARPFLMSSSSGLRFSRLKSQSTV